MMDRRADFNELLTMAIQLNTQQSWRLYTYGQDEVYRKKEQVVKRLQNKLEAMQLWAELYGDGK